MVVIARTDPHATYDDVKEAHPDWIAMTADGQPRRHWASPEMWVTCGLGPYNFEHMTEVHKEIMSLYRVDGIFINRWDGSGMCYCEHCQKNFKLATGTRLAAHEQSNRSGAATAHALETAAALRSVAALGRGSAQDQFPLRRHSQHRRRRAQFAGYEKIGELAETLMADRQARRGLTAPWANGKNGKEFRSTMGKKPIVGIFSVGVEEPYRWKDSVQSEAEIRIWVADGIANGLRPWFTKFSGTLHDPRWLKIVGDIYKWHHQAEKYLRYETPIARVGLVYSQQTAWFYGGGQARQKVEDHALGVYQTLIEARIPFEMVHDRLLDAAHIDPFKTLILPNIAALSNAQCDQLRDFVRRGGSLVATHETSLYDEDGVRRENFGLGDLFGVSFKGQVEGPMQNSYLRLENDSATGKRHPILAGLEDAPRIINGVWRVEVEPVERFYRTPLTLIPSYPDLPMEKVYPRVPKTDKSQVFLRELGQGRMVYFPWDIDRTFWEVLCLDHGRLLRNAIEWATKEERQVVVTGPGILDVTAWLQKDAMTIHLVNLTNPTMMKGPFRELIPLGEQRVRVRLPQGKRPKKAQLLVRGKPAAFVEGVNSVGLVVPSILDHEVVAIDFA
jgi:hypothetical protein